MERSRFALLAASPSCAACLVVAYQQSMLSRHLHSSDHALKQPPPLVILSCCCKKQTSFLLQTEKGTSRQAHTADMLAAVFSIIQPTRCEVEVCAAGNYDRSISESHWDNAGSVAAACASLPVCAACHQQQISKQVGIAWPTLWTLVACIARSCKHEFCDSLRRASHLISPCQHSPSLKVSWAMYA